jgi:hypothetical protein
MHTLMVIAGGLALLGLSLLAARIFGAPGSAALAQAVKAFIGLWLVCAALNMWIGVTRAGYTVGQEAPIFLVVFGVPAAAALLVGWWLARG